MDGAVFPLDCDNTLLDTDIGQADLQRHLASDDGPESRDRDWSTVQQRAPSWVAPTGLAHCSGTGTPPASTPSAALSIDAVEHAGSGTIAPVADLGGWHDTTD